MTLLAGLGEAWSTVITMLDGTQDTWKKEQVVARLINEEARRTKLHGDAIGAAHFSRDAKAKGTSHFKRRNDGNNRGSSSGSAAASSSSRGGSANANRARTRDGACRFCKKTGHWWHECPVKPANWKPSSDDNRRAHVATCNNNDREFVFVASGTTVGGVDAWILDTGATQRMMACATLLNNVTTEAPVKRVMFGNRDTLDVTGQGDLRLMVDGGPLTIKNVLVVPGLGANLLSVSQLARKGMRVNIEGTMMALSAADGVHIGTARQTGGLFMLDALPSVATAQAATSTTTLKTWHNRFGHLHNDAIQAIATKGIVNGLEFVRSSGDDEKCVEAVTLATWIRNQCVTKALPNKTPLEAWSGTKPDVTDLRTFGCTCYYHVPDATRTKLEAKARVAMYLGPSADHKAWCVWDLEHGKLVVSRDVVFYEDTFPSKSTNVPSVIIVPPPLDAADEANEAPTSPPPSASEGENGSGAVGVSEDEGNAKERDPLSPPPRITPTLASTRTRRNPHPNSKFNDYSLVAGDDEGGGDAMCLEAYTDTPSTYHGAMSSAEAAEWERALQEEYDSLMANDVYELVPMPPGAYLVGSRWVFKKKLGPNGEVERYKARLVAHPLELCNPLALPSSPVIASASSNPHSLYSPSFIALYSSLSALSGTSSFTPEAATASSVPSKIVTASSTARFRPHTSADPSVFSSVLPRMAVDSVSACSSSSAEHPSFAEVLSIWRNREAVKPSRVQVEVPLRSATACAAPCEATVEEVEATVESAVESPSESTCQAIPEEISTCESAQLQVTLSSATAEEKEETEEDLRSDCAGSDDSNETISVSFSVSNSSVTSYSTRARVNVDGVEGKAWNARGGAVTNQKPTARSMRQQQEREHAVKCREGAKLAAPPRQQQDLLGGLEAAGATEARTGKYLSVEVQNRNISNS
ncbi:unnamed protein product [Closterium sp. Yama58-4]|nr:unnamed protein product [Closterium sp. Yama58-4]